MALSAAAGVSGGDDQETMATQTSTRRDDIQGLRAIASLLVASYHIWIGTVSGGVDVFFAVGGYLLALSLLREIERTHRVDVPRTLWRNAKRLFPMAVLVLLIGGTVVLLASGPLATSRVLTDIFASATWWENWRLVGDATDYVAAGHDKSPFQHFWAMGVQGQYTALCIVAAGVFAWMLRPAWRGRARLAFGLLLGVVALASFLYAQYRLQGDPTPVYFDTFARAWELALGGFAALVVARIPLHRVVRAIMASVGLAMVLTAGLLPPEWLQPGWVSLYPVAGALLLMLAGHGADSGPVGRLLQWRGLVWLGGISYGLYLWHWPILKGFIALFPAAGAAVGPLEGMAILIVSIVISWLSYWVIVWVQRPRGAAPARPYLALAMPVVAATAVIGLLVAPAVQREAIAEAGREVQVVEDSDALVDLVIDAAETPSAPAADAIVGPDALAREWRDDLCYQVSRDRAPHCLYDDSPTDDEVWIVGDSQAVTWAPAVRAALDGAADLQLLGKSMCPFSSGEVVDRQLRPITVEGPDFEVQCAEHNAMVMALAEERLPDVVVIANGAWWVGPGYEDRPADSGAQLAAGTLGYVEQLHELGISTMYLDAPPPVGDPADCLAAHRAGTSLEPCEFTLTPAHLERHAQLIEALRAGGVTTPDTLPWFCDVASMTCPLVVDGVPTWVDRSHMGVAGALMRQELVGEPLRELLEAG